MARTRTVKYTGSWDQIERAIVIQEGNRSRVPEWNHTTTPWAHNVTNIVSVGTEGSPIVFVTYNLS